MVVRAMYRHLEHSIYLDPNAERDLEDVECTGCDWTAGGGGAGLGLTFPQIQDAVLKHTGATGHSGFRQVTTNYWRVVRSGQDVATQLSVPVVPTPGQVEPPEPT
ncbi:hypothetical protein [Streptomyces sp. NPDC002088]|uniref:DUF7848 domain-containing protein n=1 Tax=Streptomyces sp. NPDC002088 TaxID=3154665 RepID=UPI0033313C1F